MGKSQGAGKGVMTASLIFGILNFLAIIGLGVFIYWIFFGF